MTVTGSREALRFSVLGPYENNERLSICMDDPAGGDPLTVATIANVHRLDDLHRMCGLANTALSPDPAGVALTVEMIAREVRRAMLDNPTDESFNKRAAAREKIADECARTILALIQSKMVQPSIDTKPATSGTAAPVCELGGEG